MRGERSSWLTSEVNRASRSMRSWSWSTIGLKEPVRPARSGSSMASGSRVSSRPPAMAMAAAETPVSGRSDRPAAERPTAAPSGGGDEPGGEEGQGEDPEGVVRSFRSKTSK